MELDVLPRDYVSKQTILNHYRFFRDATETVRQEILSDTTAVTLKPNSYFFRQGGTANQVALLGCGSFRVFMIGEGGREITLYHVQPGEACPINILSILLEQVTPAFAIIESPVHAVCMQAENFKKWVSLQANVRQFVFETFSVRFLDMFSLLDNLKFKKLEKRLAEYLISQSIKRDHSAEVIQLTHESIAFELGSAREVVGRLLRKFKRKGIVSLSRGRICVTNKQALKSIAHE